MDPGLLIALFVGILLFFFLSGFWIGFGLALTAIILMVLGVGPGFIPEVAIMRIFRGATPFVLLVIPFFLLVAGLMTSGGITDRIVVMAQAMVGRVKGGLGYVNIIASLIFAGKSGIALGDVVGVGQVMHRIMVRAGFPAWFSCGLSAASALIAPLFPPSVPLAIYAVLSGVSVGAMFLAGVVPALLLAGSLALMNAFLAWRYDFPKGEAFSFPRLLNGLKIGGPSLGAPIILFMGIFFGVYTVTEAGVITVAYVLLLIALYRTLRLKELWQVFSRAFIDSATIMFVVAAAALYGFMAVHAGLPTLLVRALLDFSQDPLVILLLLTLFVLILGLFLETIAMLTLLTPIVMPLVTAVGIDPVHFGIVMILAAMIGLLTPPFGMILFALSKVLELPIITVFRSVLPFYVPLFALLVLLIFFPQISLWLPNLVFGR